MIFILPLTPTTPPSHVSLFSSLLPFYSLRLLSLLTPSLLHLSPRCLPQSVLPHLTLFPYPSLDPPLISPSFPTPPPGPPPPPLPTTLSSLLLVSSPPHTCVLCSSHFASYSLHYNCPYPLLTSSSPLPPSLLSLPLTPSLSLSQCLSLSVCLSVSPPYHVLTQLLVHPDLVFSFSSSSPVTFFSLSLLPTSSLLVYPTFILILVLIHPLPPRVTCSLLTPLVLPTHLSPTSTLFFFHREVRRGRGRG